MPINFGMLQPIQAPQVIASLPEQGGGGGLGGALKGLAGIMGAFSPQATTSNSTLQPMIDNLDPTLTAQPGVNMSINPQLAQILPQVLGDLRAQGFDPIIASGARTADEQRKLVANGSSQTMNSKHLHGDAVDIIDKRYGWNTNKYDKEIQSFADAMAKSAQKYGLQSGTQWKSFGPYGDFAHLAYAGKQMSQNKPQQSPDKTSGVFKDPNIVLKTIQGFEGFSPTTYWDVNAHRLGYGTDTITRPDGSIVKVKQGMTVSKEDAGRDLFRRSHDFAVGVRNQVGPELWNQFSPATQAALTSIAYNYGSIPKRLLPAVKSGDPNAIAKAIQGLGGDNKGINRARRNKEAMMVLNGMQSSMNNQQGPIAPPPAQPSPQEHKAYEDAVRAIDGGRDSYASLTRLDTLNNNLSEPQYSRMPVIAPPQNGAIQGYPSEQGFTPEDTYFNNPQSQQAMRNNINWGLLNPQSRQA